ncbi:MAG: hypothetical protein AAGU05_12735 [Anaerolineaceae bacterium]
MSAELPTRDAFFACLHEHFSALNVQPQPVDLELVEVSPLRVSGRQSGFSILFRGPADLPLPQYTYTLRHATLGEMDLFLVPVGRKAGGYEYEAVFNQLNPVA